jgi:hypothetical protein
MQLSRLALAIVVCAAAIGVSQAAGEPSARSAAANTLVASIADTTPPEDVGRRPVATVSGQILANRKFAPRRCRASRNARTENTSLGGRTVVRDFYPTNKAGKFSGNFPIEYGGTDPDDGQFRDGDVPYSGGTVTFNLVIPKTKVQKAPGSFRTYTCRPLSRQLSIVVPPSQ